MKQNLSTGNHRVSAEGVSQPSGLTRSEVSAKAWITRRANEEAASVSTDAERVSERRYKYPSNPRIDDAIREAYRLFRQFNNRHAIRNLAQRIGWPRHQVVRRARGLGLSQTKQPLWHPDEEAIVQRWGHLTDHAIRTKLANVGFHRTLTAVHLKVKRLRIKQNLDGYSAYQLSEAFGIDSHKIAAWIKRGALAAERRGTARSDAQGGDTFWIRRVDVRNFVLRFPDEIDLAKVEKFWFLDLLTDGAIAS